jgi:UDP-N-acetylglucosamine 2-epimerase
MKELLQEALDMIETLKFYADSEARWSDSGQTRKEAEEAGTKAVRVMMNLTDAIEELNK